jgi:AcrR family transcriptional regulator
LVPKAFDETEKQKIRAAMMVAGLNHFERAGIRAARVDDICRDVGIAKGSFYAFFSSKEELFMTIVQEREVQHKADMLAYLDRPAATPQQRAAGFFDLILGKMETDPVLGLVLNSGEIPHLIRKLGPERFAAGQLEDRRFAADAAGQWGRIEHRAVSANDLIGLMTIVLCVASQRRQMTTEQYAPTVALTRELFVARMSGSH